ncbi:MAG: YdeI/OmpD-associated family protein [Deltaproteobacteria bacterium]|nr:YdeI/OmpD-associated family protein [Deltaproteobacteria bacterium]
MSAETTFFATQSGFRRWLEKNHDRASELWVGLHRRATGRPSITWPEAVDEALCFGWIDGKREGIDERSYRIRFTPRKAGSNWSVVNIERAKQLIDLGSMQPAGLRAFEKRTAEKAAAYAYEQRHGSVLDPDDQKRLRASDKAWDFFQAQPPWYRRTAIYWVVSAKREETRRKRLATLIEDSAAGRPIAPLARKAPTKAPAKAKAKTKATDPGTRTRSPRRKATDPGTRTRSPRR